LQVDVLLSSAVELPPRRTMARSGAPPRFSVAEKPAAMARIATSTATTPPMPTTTTRELPNRAGRLRRLSRVI